MSLMLRRLFLVFGAPKVAYPACREGTEHAALKVYVPPLKDQQLAGTHGVLLKQPQCSGCRHYGP